MKLTVVHLEGSKQGLTETFSGQVITVGRDPSNTLSFDPFKDLDVSTRHASITVQGNQVVLQDLGSTNGTYFNDEKISAAVPLPAGGCMVRFGENGPKVQLTWTLDTGPGKKTVMIQELRGELEQQGAATVEAKKRTRKVAMCFVVLVILGAIVFGVVSSMRASSKLREEVKELSAEVVEKQSAAQNVTAGETGKAKAKYDEAIAALEAAKKAEEEGDLETAKKQYTSASKAFDLSVTQAAAESKKRWEALQKESEEREKREKKEREDQAKRDAALMAKLRDEIKKRDEERERKAKEAQQKLEAAASTQELFDELDKLKESKNPAEIEESLKAIDAALAKLDPNSEEAKKLLALKKEQEESLKSVKDLTPEDLKTIAKNARPSIVAIKASYFGIPKGQTLKTTRLRYQVAEGLGTGFLVSKEGHIITAKEVVKPELFDAKALARLKKLEEKGMTFHRQLAVLTYDANKRNYAPVTSDVVVAREFPDSLAGTEKVTIDFDNQKAEIEVKPHKRDESDLVVLKIDIKDAAVLELAPVAADKDLPVINLGVQSDDKPEERALYMFSGRLTEPGETLKLAVPSFRTWIGGPVLDAGGRVVGVLINHGVKESVAVSVDSLRDVVKKKE